MERGPAAYLGHLLDRHVIKRSDTLWPQHAAAGQKDPHLLLEPLLFACLHVHGACTGQHATTSIQICITAPPWLVPLQLV